MATRARTPLPHARVLRMAQRPAAARGGSTNEGGGTKETKKSLRNCKKNGGKTPRYAAPTAVRRQMDDPPPAHSAGILPYSVGIPPQHTAGIPPHAVGIPPTKVGLASARSNHWREELVTNYRGIIANKHYQLRQLGWINTTPTTNDTNVQGDDALSTYAASFLLKHFASSPERTMPCIPTQGGTA